MYTERENSGLFCAHVFGIEGSFREFQNHALLGNIQDTSAKKKTNKQKTRPDKRKGTGQAFKKFTQDECWKASLDPTV